jgi:hypothetical protein
VESKNLRFGFFCDGWERTTLNPPRALPSSSIPTYHHCSCGEHVKIAPDETRGKANTHNPPPSRRDGMTHPQISRIVIS